MEKLRLLLFTSIVSILLSCSTTKSSIQNGSNENELSKSNINFTYSLGEFVQTIDLEKLCNPVRLHVIFSVDSSGRLYDSDFKPSTFTIKECNPDTVYINTMKINFENQMPNWKPTLLNDSIKMVRYSIPVTFD